MAPVLLGTLSDRVLFHPVAPVALVAQAILITFSVQWEAEARLERVFFLSVTLIDRSWKVAPAVTVALAASTSLHSNQSRSEQLS
jgi:hypothetical protein